MAVILETPRLRLRELGAADLPFVADLLGHAEVMAYWPRPLAGPQAAAWILKQQARYAEDGYGYWLAVRKSDGAPVGQAGLMRTKVGGRFVVALGYIVHRPYWRMGYASEASAACIAYAFGTLRRRRVVALIRPENGPSVALAGKIGMTPGRTVFYVGFPHVLFSISGRTTPER